MKTQNILKSLFIIIALISFACSKEPQPIDFGNDICEHCRMKIMDKRFGAEIVTDKGKIYKFDAVECMIDYTESNKLQEKDIHKLMVVDFSLPTKLIDATKSYYLISADLPSPMGANLSAYGDQTIAERQKGTYRGEIYNWSELLKILKK